MNRQLLRILVVVVVVVVAVVDASVLFCFL